MFVVETYAAVRPFVFLKGPSQRVVHTCDRKLITELLGVGGYMHRLDGGQGQAMLFAPSEEGRRRAGIGGAGVRVPDLRCKELDITGCGALALGHDGRRNGQLT
jgi:hypothetical protein